MPAVACSECSWRGDYSETYCDFVEDSDGDMVGEHMGACPECHAYTTDDHGLDDEDLSDTYGS